jgi:6-phosphogluconolactonase
MSIEFDTARGKVHVFGDTDRLAFGLADLITAQARRAVAARRRFTLALSGAHAPLSAYRLLAEPPFKEELPWQGMHIFFVEERWEEAEEARGHEDALREAFLDAVPLPPGHVHSMRAAVSLGDAAARYDRLLHAAFPEDGIGPDLVVLGVETDGSTASLFPYSPALRQQHRTAMEVTVSRAADAETEEAVLTEEDAGTPGSARAVSIAGSRHVTLTAPFLNSARVVVFVASGPARTHILKEVIEGPEDPQRLPAQLVKPAAGDLVWYLDTEAAALLSRARR